MKRFLISAMMLIFTTGFSSHVIAHKHGSVHKTVMIILSRIQTVEPNGQSAKNKKYCTKILKGFKGRLMAVQYDYSFEKNMGEGGATSSLFPGVVVLHPQGIKGNLTFFSDKIPNVEIGNGYKLTSIQFSATKGKAMLLFYNSKKKYNCLLLSGSSQPGF